MSVGRAKQTIVEAKEISAAEIADLSVIVAEWRDVLIHNAVLRADSTLRGTTQTELALFWWVHTYTLFGRVW